MRALALELALDVCDDRVVSSVQDRPERHLRIPVPGPPVPFTAHELVTFRRLTREKLRRVEKRALQSRDKEFSGRNVNESHARRLHDMDAKIVAWLTEVWPVVAAARGEDVETGLETWLESSLLETDRAANG